MALGVKDGLTEFSHGTLPASIFCREGGCRPDLRDSIRHGNCYA